jgi:small subunit ribosomal protein S6
MKKYELMAIYKPNLDAEEIDKALDALSKTAKDLKGKVESVDKTGRKKLAYDIQGFRDGFFATVVVSLPEESVAEFKRQLRLNDNILRTMFLEASKVSA